MKRKLLIFIILFFLNTFNIYAQEYTDSESRTFQGKIIDVLSVEEIYIEEMDIVNIKQVLAVEIDRGENSEQIQIQVGNEYQNNNVRYDVGDRIIVMETLTNIDGEEHTSYYISDFNRKPPLTTLFIFFVLITLVIGRKGSLRAFGGLLVSIVSVFVLIIPLIMSGKNPILVTLLTGFIIVPITFIITHGYRRKTIIAIFGTLVALLLSGILALIFVQASYITGLGMEEAFFIQTQSQIDINITDLVIAGIVISLLGVLDDVTITQASIVEQLRSTGKKLGTKELYNKAMNVGKDHIASMINTLVLAYAGASIPLLLIFSLASSEPLYVLNLEIVAVEIVRTLVGSIGLLIAIPLTTLFAVKMTKGQEE